jgi:hypothetical protein
VVGDVADHQIIISEASKMFGLKQAMTTTAIAAAMAVGGASMASAATYTFDFDIQKNVHQNGNNPATYEENGYTFTPYNGNAANSCFDDRCYLETTNGTPTVLSNDLGGSFDLISLYFNFQGVAPNSIVFSDFDNDAQTDDDFLTIALNTAYDGTKGYKIFDASTFSLVTTALAQQVGYFITFEDTFVGDGDNGVFASSFDGIKYFSTEAVQNKQVRIDCVSISEDGSNMSSSALSSCAPDTTTAVPVPAAGILLISALGGLGVATRRRRKSS